MTSREMARRWYESRRATAPLAWIGAVCVLAFTLWLLAKAVREAAAMSRAARGDGHMGVFTAERWVGGRESGWYGSFATATDSETGYELRGVDNDTVELGEAVPALDVGSPDFVFAAGGSPEWGQTGWGIVIVLAMAVFGLVLLAAAVRATSWSRFRRELGAEAWRERARGLADRDRWGPAARTASARRVDLHRSAGATAGWACTLPLFALDVLLLVALAREHPGIELPEDRVLLLVLLALMVLVLPAGVQVVRMVVLRPRLWLTGDALLIWDSVLLGRVARIPRDEIAAVLPHGKRSVDLGGGGHAELTPFQEPLNLDILVRTAVELPARSVLGNWIWQVRDMKGSWGPALSLPERGTRYRRIAVRARDPQRALADIERWLDREPPAARPAWTPADHFLHGREAVFRGRGGRGITVNGPFPQPVVAEFTVEGTGLRASLRADGRGRHLVEITPGGPAARAVLDGGPDRRRHLRIDARGPWTARFTGPQDLGEFDGHASGQGGDVLLYRGPPGIAVVNGADELHLRAPDLTSLYGGPVVSDAGRVVLGGGRSRRAEVAVPSGAAVQIRSAGTWTIDVHPLVGLPHDPQVLTGPGADLVVPVDGHLHAGSGVLLYTGPPGRVGAFGERMHRLGPDLAPAAPLVPRRGRVELDGRTLVQVVTVSAPERRKGARRALPGR